ncbi:hypothetical protein [Amycolatopsis sp. WAC 04182]|uniref:hypothetical protein n=1 Tax=Amycolatopsis sp. WAC 04182 TaxID=2203198 RepID=UPI001F2C75E1|nr:hypothetical protein [Amycolatopsis sp. WAC 04182]
MIHIDPEAIHPVVDDVWHRTRLARIPEPGQVIAMLCGVTAAATFEPLNQRRAHGAPTECPDCDRIYRQEHNIPQARDRLRQR